MLKLLLISIGCSNSNAFAITMSAAWSLAPDMEAAGRLNASPTKLHQSPAQPKANDLSFIHSFYPRTRSVLMQASSCVSLAILIPIVILSMPRLVPSLDAEPEGHVSLASLYGVAV